MGIDEVLSRVQTALPRLDPVEALAAAAQPDTFIVDTRPEFQRRVAGEVPGALVIERNHLEWRLDPRCDARIPEAVDLDVRWIVICAEGYSSSLAALSLRQLGLSRSTDVIGGFEAWERAGLPVRRPATPSRPRRPGEGPVGRYESASTD